MTFLNMTTLLYFTALSLSIVSAYYSIAGLTAIFAAAVIPIIVMGGVLEFAKLVVASWLYRSWKTVPFLMRTYFTVALVILMTLTSMGIFGFLSKAHLDQAVPTGDVASKVAILDEKIKTEKENIDAARQTLKQMDAQVDQTLSRSTSEQGADKSLQIRRGQQKERSSLLAEIGSAQSRIARLNEERAPIASELRKVEAEVGPIKYIAALLYGDNPDQTILEKAVRIVIIMIVVVFDPLAVLLLMAASMPTTKKEEHHDSTEETSSTGEDNSYKESIEASVNKIKERFFTKFSRSEEPASTGDSEPSSGDSSTSEDQPSEQAEVTTWTISEPPPTEEPPASEKVVEYDSAGRRITPLSEEERTAKSIAQEVEDLEKR